MSRLRVAEVYVVNWLGYPASRWRFDGPVIQFHGENGAGKTTAMAAIVAALVPNAARIDSIFRGSAPGHAGLRTKVGVDGNPSYSVLRVEREGTAPLYLGARLTANPAAQTGVSVTPFAAHGFPEPPDPSLWLTADDSGIRRVATLDEIGDAAGRAGGSFRQFSGPGEYYPYLHQLGILPRPLKNREDQEQFAKLYLAGFGGDAAQLVYRLKDHFLPEQERLGANLQTMDEVYRRLIRGRADIDAYEAKRRVLEKLWEAANELVQCAWANDEFRLRSARAEAVKADADLKKTAADESGIKATLADLLARRPGLQAALDAALSARDRGRDAIVERITSLDHAIDERRRIDANRAALPDLTALVDGAIGDWPSFLAARDRAKELRTTVLAGAADLRRTLADLDSGIAALEYSGEVLRETALARQPHFADLNIEAARQLQARLGPAVNASVVDDPDKAAASALSDPLTLEHSWFIKTGDVDGIISPPPPTESGLIVPEGAFLRASKLPDRPILGTAARTRTLRALQKGRDDAAIGLDATERRAAEIEAALDKTAAIAQSADLFPNETLPPVLATQARRTGLQEALSAGPHGRWPAMSVAEDKDIAEAWRTAMSYGAAADEALTRARDDITRYQERLVAAERATARAREAARDAQLEAGERAASRDAWLEQALGEQLLSHLSEPGWLEGLQGDFVADRLAKRAAAAGQSLQGQVNDASFAGTLILAANDAVDQINAATVDQSPATCLRVWRAMRDSAFSLMPRNLTSTNDPVEACAALSARVAELRVDVERAERLFRVETTAIRSAIESAVSQQRRRIEGLNRGREDARFGDLSGIRLKLTAKTEILDQLDAFMTEVGKISADLSFAEALETVARSAERGQRRALAPDVTQLTDYRNYAELGVEVRHRDSESWRSIEEEDPSTGERIGIAFVCLLLVLESWETRSMNVSFLPGTCLRFLVIDEAARLDSTGLATIAAYAETADAQVLVAAPQEQPIPGSRTTYTFVRTRDPGGAPRVVTRRRVLITDQTHD